MANNVPVIQGAVMFDAALAELQQALVDALPWLNVCFGKSQRITKAVEGRRYMVPSVYCGGWDGHGDNDYIEVSPDSKIGNFAFFELNEPQELEPEPWAARITTPVSLIVWFDLRKVYAEPNNRNTDYLKAQILRVLNGRDGFHLTAGRVRFNRCYERAENIYRGYSLDEIDNQFLMHPYGGFRFDGEMEIFEPCSLEIITESNYLITNDGRRFVTSDGLLFVVNNQN